jgi:uncharacterized membrane protein YeaQ/YmgE (transglycosylase-associated protein family)
MKRWQQRSAGEARLKFFLARAYDRENRLGCFGYTLDLEHTKMNMSGESLLIILVVGVIAGWLAGQIVQGTGFGIVGDLIIGVVGAFIGAWLLPQLGIHLGSGIIAAIINATIGALILLLIIRLVGGGGRWGGGWGGRWARRW